MLGTCEMRRLNQKSNLSRIRYGESHESRIYLNMQSNLIDSNATLHMHLTVALSSAHVKFNVWTGPNSKHFDNTISLICAPQITDLKINVWDTSGLWNIDPFRFDSEELRGWQQTQYLLQNPYMNGVFTLLVVYCIQVLKCRMTPPRNSTHQCLVTKILNKNKYDHFTLDW